MSFFPAFEQILVRGVNGKTVASTLVGTTRNDARKFISTLAVIHATVANAITVPPTISIGTNGTSYNNLLAAATLTGMTSVDNYLCFTLGGSVLSAVAANTGIYANISAGATGTSMTLDIAIFGFYKG